MPFLSKQECRLAEQADVLNATAMVSPVYGP